MDAMSAFADVYATIIIMMILIMFYQLFKGDVQ